MAYLDLKKEHKKEEQDILNREYNVQLGHQLEKERR